MLLAVFSLFASDLPSAWAWPLALLAGSRGMIEIRRYAMQSSCTLLIPTGTGEARCDDVRMDALQMSWRGPLAFLCWRDPQGARRRLVFLPDVLPVATRRELKLAIQRREAAAVNTASVAD